MYCDAAAFNLVAACCNTREVLLEIEEIVVLDNRNHRHKAIRFTNGGATLSLCTHRWAKRMGYVGEISMV